MTNVVVDPVYGEHGFAAELATLDAAGLLVPSADPESPAGPVEVDETDWFDDTSYEVSRVDVFEWQQWAGVDQDEAERTLLADRAPAWVSLPPGGDLATALEQVRVQTESPMALIEVMKAAVRLSSWAEALKLAAMAAFDRQREAQAADIPRPAQLDAHGRPVDPQRSRAAEIACALRLSPTTVHKHIDTALRLTSTLSATYSALRCGALTLSKAISIADATEPLTSDQARAVEAHVLKRAAGQTHANLRASLRRQVAKVDARNRAERHRRAVAERVCRVVPLADGMAGLWVTHTADKIQQIYVVIKAMADLAKRDHPTPASPTDSHPGDRFPTRGAAPTYPAAPAATTVPDATTVPATASVPDASTVRGGTTVLAATAVPDATTVPATASVPDASTVRGGTTVLAATTVPDAATVPATATVPDATTATATATVRDALTVPGATRVRDALTVPGATTVRDATTAPNSPTAPDATSAPGDRNGSGIEEVPGDAYVHGAGATEDGRVSDGPAGVGGSDPRGAVDRSAVKRQTGDDRTAEQRRADVVADLFEHMLHNGLDWLGRRLPDQHRRKPHIEVTIPATTLLGLNNNPCELTGYGPIPADLARRIAADGTWRRLLTDPTNGTVLEASTTRHNPSMLVSETLIARYPTCVWPGCNRPARECDRDHTTPFTRTGETSLGGLGMFCEYHHVIKDTPQWGWRAINNPDQSITLISPTGHRYTTVPPARGPIPNPPVAHTNPAHPADLVDPADPVDPVDPAGPADSAEPPPF